MTRETGRAGAAANWPRPAWAGAGRYWYEIHGATSRWMLGFVIKTGEDEARFAQLTDAAIHSMERTAGAYPDEKLAPENTLWFNDQLPMWAS